MFARSTSALKKPYVTGSPDVVSVWAVTASCVSGLTPVPFAGSADQALEALTAELLSNTRIAA